MRMLRIRVLNRSRRLVDKLPAWFKRLVYSGDRCLCTCCGSRLRSFRNAWINISGTNLQCPVCGSLERHRLMVLFLAEETSLFDGAARRLLHIAPEQALAGVWATRAPNVQVVTMDLTAPSVSVHTDITRMPFPDASFDAIICSHVLEHIPEEQAALRELRRVLRPDGWALVVIPLMLSDRPTYEDSTITTAQGRLAAFGQEDHVRTYGTDAELRVARSGFDVRTIHHYDHVSDEDVAKYGLVAEPFFVCTHFSAAPNININRRVSQQSE